MGFISGLFAAATTIVKAVNIIATAVSAVTTIVTAVSKVLGLTQTDNPEELGQKALQAEEQNIRPEDFKSYAEYVKEVESLDLDPARVSKWSKEQKEAKALEVSASVFTEQFGVENTSAMFQEIAKRPDFFTPERTKQYFEVSQEKSIDLGKISDLINNKTTDVNKILEAKNLMFEIEKTINPELTSLENSKKIMELRAD